MSQHIKDLLRQATDLVPETVKSTEVAVTMQGDVIVTVSSENTVAKVTSAGLGEAPDVRERLQTLVISDTRKEELLREFREAMMSKVPSDASLMGLRFEGNDFVYELHFESGSHFTYRMDIVEKTISIDSESGQFGFNASPENGVYVKL